MSTSDEERDDERDEEPGSDDEAQPDPAADLRDAGERPPSEQGSAEDELRAALDDADLGIDADELIDRLMDDDDSEGDGGDDDE